jgi:integrase
MRKTIKHSNYTFTKRGVYYFSKRIPQDIQSHYQQSRIVHSLRTKDKNQAHSAACHLSEKLEHFWFQLRLQNQAEQLSNLKFIKQAHLQLSIDDALEYYLKERGEGRSSLFHEHARRYVRYLKEAVKGKEKLDRFNNKDALQFRNSLKQKGLSNSSLIKAFSSIKAIFSFAIKEHGLAIENPFSNIYLPSAKEDAKKRIPISTMDLKLIQTECIKLDDDLRWLIALISDTGMRLAEATGLKINDLVLDDEIPHVIIQPHSHRPLKTRSSERVIPLVGVSLWAAQRIKQNVTGEYCFLRYTNNDRTNANSASAALNKWIKVLTKNKGNTIHGFRHKFRDRLRAVNAPLEMIDQIGGWSAKTVGQSYGTGYNLLSMQKILCKFA